VATPRSAPPRSRRHCSGHRASASTPTDIALIPPFPTEKILNHVAPVSVKGQAPPNRSGTGITSRSAPAQRACAPVQWSPSPGSGGFRQRLHPGHTASSAPQPAARPSDDRGLRESAPLELADFPPDFAGIIADQAYSHGPQLREKQISPSSRARTSDNIAPSRRSGSTFGSGSGMPESPGDSRRLSLPNWPVFGTGACTANLRRGGRRAGDQGGRSLHGTWTSSGAWVAPSAKRCRSS
jgi:hypothetical protein